MNVVLSGDDNYSPYMATTMVNLRKYLPNNIKTDFYILYSGNDEVVKNNLTDFVNNKLENSSIKFYDVAKKNKKELEFLKDFHHGEHLSIGTYALYFVADAFPEIDKALYMDVDIIINDNLLPMYETDLKDKYAGVVRHTDNSYHGINKICKNGMNFKEYFAKFYEDKNCETYFNAGIQLMNLKKMREDKCSTLFLKEMKRIGLKTFKSDIEYHNQDFFNSVFYEKTLIIDMRYNINVNRKFKFKSMKKFFPAEIAENLDKAVLNPAIIHCTGSKKPWNNFKVKKSRIWWRCAFKTPFIKYIIRKNTKKLLKSFF